MRAPRNIEIEYLRAVSILLVLVGHVIWLSPYIGEAVTPSFRYLSFGVGVDLFFCISGYVVSRSYVDYFDRYAGSGNFWAAARGFWLRRAYRLLPSAWLWVLVGISCSLYFNQSGAFLSVEQNLKSALAVLTFTANIAHMYEALAPNNVYWSLSLEEQFYILLPFFLLLMRTPRSRIIALLLIVLVQFPLSRNPFGDTVAQYLASFRIDGFAWGILIYLFSQSESYQRWRPTLLARYRVLALSVTVFLLFLLVAVPAQLYSSSLHMGLVAMLAACLVWLASYDRGCSFGFGGPNKVLGWLGSRSYAIYLIHMPVFKLVHELAVRYLLAVDQPYGPALVPYLLAGSTVLIIALAELNFRFVEEPMRRLGAARTGRELEKTAHGGCEKSEAGSKAKAA